MERDNNAVLAVRICGLAFAAVELRSLMWWAGSAWPWWRGADARDLAFLIPYLLGIGFGVGAFLLAPGLSGLAGPAQADDARDGVREALRLGVLVLGVYFALVLMAMLSRLVRDLAMHRQTAAVPWAEATTVVVLLVWPRAVVRCLRRRADPGPEATGARKVIAVGLALAGVWLLIGSAGAVIGRLGSVVHGMDESTRDFYLRRAFTDALYVAMAAAMAWWSGPIAQRLPAVGAEAASPARALGPGLCLRVAVYLIGAYEVASRLAYYTLLALPQRANLFSPAVSLVISLILKAALVAATVWGVRALGRWLGRRTYPEETDSEEAAATATVVVQIGLLLAALLWLTRALGPLPAAPSRAVEPLVVGAVLLLFWAQVGRWMVGPAGEDAEALRERRTAALRPWLVLLGFYVSVGSLARTLTWLLAVTHVLAPLQAPSLGFHGNVYPRPSFVWIAGLVLVLASGPLSRWLAYDSIIGLWSNIGWRRMVKRS